MAWWTGYWAWTAASAGWVGVLLGEEPSGLRRSAHRRPGGRAGDPIDVVGVDIPIGLADSGHRLADILARKAAGVRRCRVHDPGACGASGRRHPTALAISRDRPGRDFRCRRSTSGPRSWRWTRGCATAAVVWWRSTPNCPSPPWRAHRWPTARPPRPVRGTADRCLPGGHRVPRRLRQGRQWSPPGRGRRCARCRCGGLVRAPGGVRAGRLLAGPAARRSAMGCRVRSGHDYQLDPATPTDISRMRRAAMLWQTVPHGNRRTRNCGRAGHPDGPRLGTTGPQPVAGHIHERRSHVGRDRPDRGGRRSHPFVQRNQPDEEIKT